MKGKELPEGWKWKRLGDVCTKPQYGYTTSAKFDGSGPKFLRTTDITKGHFDWNNVPFCEQMPDDEEKYELHEGDILISRAGSIGASFVVKNPPRAVFASYLIRFQPKKGLDPNFADFFLKSNLFKNQLGGSTTGTTLQGVNAQNLAKIKIPLPPLQVQRQIVAVLEQAEVLKRQRQEADAHTGALLQSVFYEMFGDPVKNEKGWERKSFKEILSEDPQNGLYKPSSEYRDDGTPIIRIDSFYTGKIEKINTLKRIKCTPTEIENYLVQEGDVLINRVNSLEYLGKCGLVPKTFEATIYECNMIRLRPEKALVDPTYLTTFLCTQFVKNQILNRAKKAVNQASINQQDVKVLSILVPPLALQQQFARIVEEVERIREKQAESGKEIEALYGVLMQRAFRGELVA
jgi:type I restriction enzyme, S subunit